MNLRYYITGIVLLIATAGCVKDFKLTPDETAPLYVIEGKISNLGGPYYVRITKSTNLLRLGHQVGNPGIDSAEPVKGALVIIADDRGVTDTLIPGKTANSRYYYYYKNGVIDSIMDLTYHYYYTIDRGYYETTKFTGQPGHTYQLTVRIGNEEFHASAYMPPVPMLDSAVIKETTVDPDGTKGYLPFVWFKEPANENNYYLFQYNPIQNYPYENAYTYYGAGMNFPYYVLDDKTMPAYVNDLAVRVLTSDHYQFSDSYPYLSKPNNPIQVKLSSLTKETFEYISVLGKQLRDDGNVYKPVPASLKGNISGNALGLFWATHVSYKLVMP
ncbi:MAG TPA: DUF4249 domain-containing protein [Niastella sp.]